MWLFPCAEVPAKAVVRTARNIVADLGTEAASSSRGLKRVADCSLSNAERDTSPANSAPKLR